MLIKKKNPVYFLLIIGVALSVYFVWQTEFYDKQKEKSATISDWNAVDVTTNEYNEAGTLKNQLFSPYVIHYLKTDSTALTKPELLLLNPGENSWKITAKQAKVTNDLNTTISEKEQSKDSKIILEEDVVIRQKMGSHNGDSTITTTQLTIHPNQQTAETNQPVTMIRRELDGSVVIVKAVGVTVNQKTGDIHLLAKVRVYAKNKANN